MRLNDRAVGNKQAHESGLSKVWRHKRKTCEKATFKNSEPYTFLNNTKFYEYAEPPSLTMKRTRKQDCKQGEQWFSCYLSGAVMSARALHTNCSVGIQSQCNKWCRSGAGDCSRLSLVADDIRQTLRADHHSRHEVARHRAARWVRMCELWVQADAAAFVNRLQTTSKPRQIKQQTTSSSCADKKLFRFFGIERCRSEWGWTLQYACMEGTAHPTGMQNTPNTQSSWLSDIDSRRLHHWFWVRAVRIHVQLWSIVVHTQFADPRCEKKQSSSSAVKQRHKKGFAGTHQRQKSRRRFRNTDALYLRSLLRVGEVHIRRESTTALRIDSNKHRALVFVPNHLRQHQKVIWLKTNNVVQKPYILTEHTQKQHRFNIIIVVAADHRKRHEHAQTWLLLEVMATTIEISSPSQFNNLCGDTQILMRVDEPDFRGSVLSPITYWGYFGRTGE